MTPTDLEQIERGYAKAQAGDGPQRMADWAAKYGPAIMAALHRAESDAVGDPFAPLRALYPGVGTAQLVQHVADDVRALREDRAKRTQTLQVDVGPLKAIEGFGEKLVDVVRPFAAFGAPEVLERIDELRTVVGAAEDVPFLAVDDADGNIIAAITPDNARAAYELVRGFDAE